MNKKNTDKRKIDNGDDVQITIKSEKTPDDEIVLGEKVITAMDIVSQVSRQRKLNKTKRRKKNGPQRSFR